jgi:hypothetical protein
MNIPMSRPASTSRARVAVVAMIVGGLGVLAACSVLQADAGAATKPEESRLAVSEATGFTKTVVSQHYIVVVNVLPSEHMMTMGDMQMEHPTIGEQIIEGKGNPIGVGVRHVEAHVYDRATGKVLTSVVPKITLLNRTTGETVDVPPTLMQDVIVGALDLHFGNNVPVTGNSDVSVRVNVNGEEVTVDGHLD